MEENINLLVEVLEKIFKDDRYTYVILKNNDIYTIAKCYEISDIQTLCFDSEIEFTCKAKKREVKNKNLFDLKSKQHITNFKVGDYVVVKNELGRIDKVLNKIPQYEVTIIGKENVKYPCCEYELMRIDEPTFKYGDKVIWKGEFKATVKGYDKCGKYIILMHNEEIGGINESCDYNPLWGDVLADFTGRLAKEEDLKPYIPKYYFDKFKYIEDCGVREYKNNYSWVDKCHGLEVIDKKMTDEEGTTHFGIRENWCIEKIEEVE